MLWSLPNILTYFRLAAAPVLALLFALMPATQAALAAFLLFSLSALTDFFDGYLARRLGQTSKLGAALDPIADKAAVLTMLACLSGIYWPDTVILLPVAVIFLRETLVSGLREALGAKASALSVTSLAKWKTTAQLLSIAVLLAGAGFESALLTSLGFVLLWIATLLTAITGIDYLRKSLPLLGGGE